MAGEEGHGPGDYWRARHPAPPAPSKCPEGAAPAPAPAAPAHHHAVPITSQPELTQAAAYNQS